MPRLAAESAASGGRVFTRDPHSGGPCDCRGAAALLRHRVLPYPDQSRYGRATTDPPRYNTDGTPCRVRPEGIEPPTNAV